MNYTSRLADRANGVIIAFVTGEDRNVHSGKIEPVARWLIPRLGTDAFFELF